MLTVIKPETTPPPAVAAVPIGCRSAAEVDQVVDSMLTPVAVAVWDAFAKTFDARVEALGRAAHWYYDKSASKI